MRESPPSLRALRGVPEALVQTSPGRNISPICCCGRPSARGSGPYSLGPLRRSVGYLLRFAVLGEACRPGKSSVACPLAGTKRHRRFVFFRLSLQLLFSPCGPLSRQLGALATMFWGRELSGFWVRVYPSGIE